MTLTTILKEVNRGSNQREKTAIMNNQTGNDRVGWSDSDSLLDHFDAIMPAIRNNLWTGTDYIGESQPHGTTKNDTPVKSSYFVLSIRRRFKE